MTREWQPGDVANVLHRGFQPAFRHQKGWTYIDGSTATTTAADGYTFRPLVVIDPEDREQVERLLSLYHDARCTLNDLDPTGDMQVGLRNFADPPSPRPDEPLLLGAVVEDDEGERWVRVYGATNTPNYDAWKKETRVSRNTWSDVNAVRVLSPGYDPEATT